MKRLLSIAFIALSLASSGQSICLAWACKQTITTADTVNVFVRLTSPDGYKSITWQKLSGPTIVLPIPSITRIDSQTVQSLFTLKKLAAGTYIFGAAGLSTSGMTATANDTVIANAVVISSPARAQAGPDQIITLPNNTIVLSGSNSSYVTTSWWRQIAGPSSIAIGNPSLQNTIAAGFIVGKYQFELNINGGASLDTMQVTVLPGLVRPEYRYPADANIRSNDCERVGIGDICISIDGDG